MWKRLAGDATILSLMGLTGQSTADVAKRIIKRSSYEGLAGSEVRLNLYFRPARRGKMDAFHEQVLQVDCHVPAMQDYIAYRVQEQVYSLLHDWKANQKPLYFEGQLGELPTAPSFVCVGSRYTYHATI